MENIVALIERAAPNRDLENDLANAQTFVAAANNENQAAKSALLQSLSPDQSLAHIQQSLQSLSDAYQKFFDIATIAETLLPTRSQ
jgi:hypothetical protein